MTRSFPRGCISQFRGENTDRFRVVSPLSFLSKDTESSYAIRGCSHQTKIRDEMQFRVSRRVEALKRIKRNWGVFVFEISIASLKISSDFSTGSTGS